LRKKEGKLSHKLLPLAGRFDLKPVWKGATARHGGARPRRRRARRAGHLDEPRRFDLVQVTPHFHGA